MPIDISQVVSTAQATPSANSPKYFSKNLTGSGKSTGLLNDRKRPGRYDNGMTRQTAPNNSLTRKERQYNGKVTTQVIPFSPFFAHSITNSRGRGMTFAVPGQMDRFDLTDGKSNLDFEAYLDMIPQGALLVEDENGIKMSRHLDVKYMMLVTVVPKTAKQGTSAMLFDNAPSKSTTHGQEPFVLVDWSYAPLDDATELIKKATQNHTPTGQGLSVDDIELAQWMDEYDLHERISRLASVWDSDQIGDVIGLHIEELATNNMLGDQTTIDILAAQLLYLEMYSVPLSSYRKIHSALQNHVADEDLRTQLSNQNLQLLMNHVLDNLDNSKPNLPNPPRPQGHVLQTQINQPGGGNAPTLSRQQRNAVDTDEPLVLVQAGAGTGKSTVIIERIENLVSRGVDPAEITVLSFTNAAADNIIERNPNVGSMTIAKMVHEIYQLNYPTQALGGVDTLLNTLDIKFPTDSFVEAFRPRLLRVAQNKPGALTELSNFIGRNIDRVVTTLNYIRQTCLELEVIIAYHQIETMQEPPSIRSQYLIVDEVQDNSIFEFIYLLKYVTKHQENMFIVGGKSLT